MTNKENSNFEEYIKIRTIIRDSHHWQWELLNVKILDLIEKTEDLSPEIIEDIKEAYDLLAEGIIPSIFPNDIKQPKDFTELQRIELSLLKNIPNEIKEMFNILLKAYLKNSTNNPLNTDDNHLWNVVVKFNNENADLRYPDRNTNPYLDRYWKIKDLTYDWRRDAKNEFGIYYQETLKFLSSIRNFQAHKNDIFTSRQFDLAKRNIVDPISGIKHPGNYLLLCNAVIIFVYAFVEILQIWIDTQIRVQKI